jgi:hypothetical protein
MGSQQGLLGFGGETSLLPNELNQSFQRGSQGIDWTNFINTANQAGTLYGQQVPQALNLQALLSRLSGQAGNEMGALDQAGAQTYQTALDPQQALYGRTLQQVLDTGRAGQAARGLGTSAEGQRLENQDVSNFNIDWQNQQLQRQLAGLQGMSGAANAGANQGQLAGRLGAGALDAGALAPQLMQQSGAVPMQAAQQWANFPGQNATQYIQQLMQLMGAYQSPQNQITPYMNQGIGAGANAAGAQLRQNQFGAQQQAGGLNALTQGLQGLSNAFGNNFGQGGVPGQFTFDQFANPTFPTG